MAAVVEMRRLLDELETVHVANAVRDGWSWQRIADRLAITRQAAHHRHAAHVARVRGRERDGATSRLTVTGDARQAVNLARRSAAALGSPAVETEHLLLGLLQVPDGIAAAALAQAGIELASAWTQAAALQEPVATVTLDGERLPISPSLRDALEQSLREAVRRADEHLGGEHLLLALLRAPGGRAVQVLMGLGVSPTTLEAALAKKTPALQLKSPKARPAPRPRARPQRSKDRAESSRQA